MSSLHYDVLVVGAGVEGSATAYNLSRRGQRVALLEQFPLPHNRGSSHGQTRITRKAYPEQYYTEMMNYATDEWTMLQEHSGDTLYKQIGYLAIGEHNGQFLNDNISSMSQHGAPYKVLSPPDFRKHFPMLRYGENIGGVLDPEGGILMADKAVKAFQKCFTANGGSLFDGEKVIEVIPGETIQIKTNKRGYSCRAVVFACGPWTNSVLRLLNLTLPLQPVRISVCYWPERVLDSHTAAKLPTFFEGNCCAGYSIYGLPSEEYPGHVKLCLHGGPVIDPESRDTPDSQWTIDSLKEYVGRHFPGLVASPSIVETCIHTVGDVFVSFMPYKSSSSILHFSTEAEVGIWMYQINTPDKDFILDSHPKWKNIIIGAGFSGHGFKLAPAVGHVLADLALDVRPKFDLQPFKMSRFSGFNKAKL